jgi:hypothetical protein
VIAKRKEFVSPDIHDYFQYMRMCDLIELLQAIDREAWTDSVHPGVQLREIQTLLRASYCVVSLAERMRLNP